MWETFALQKLLSFFELKSFSHFLNKNISVFGCKVVKHLASWPLNELVKLIKLVKLNNWALKSNKTIKS